MVYWRANFYKSEVGADSKNLCFLFFFIFTCHSTLQDKKICENLTKLQLWRLFIPCTLKITWVFLYFVTKPWILLNLTKKSHVIIMVPKATCSEKCEKMSFCTTLKPYFFMGTCLYHWKSFRIQTTILEILKKLNLVKKYVGAWAQYSFKEW